MPYYIERKPNGVYRLRGVHHDIPAGDRSLKTRCPDQAEAMREAAERKVFREIVLGLPPEETFAELARDYMIAGKDLGRCSIEIISELGTKKTTEIRITDLDKLAKRIYPNAKPATINRNIISPVSAIMNWAAAADRAPLRKWPRRRERQSRTDWRRPEEMEAIIAKLSSPEARALMALYLGCGLRASEAVFLDGREIAPDLSQLTVLGTVRPDDEGALAAGYYGTKGFKDRTVPIPLRAQQFLAPVVNLGAGRALVNSRGQPWTDRNALNKTLRAACVRAGKTPIGIHAVRHTWATWQQAVHGDLVILMKHGGWSVLSLVQRYAHASDRLLKGEVLASGWAQSGQGDPENSEKPSDNNAQAA